jgi:hypothetical protein
MVNATPEKKSFRTRKTAPKKKTPFPTQMMIKKTTTKTKAASKKNVALKSTRPSKKCMPEKKDAPEEKKKKKTVPTKKAAPRKKAAASKVKIPRKTMSPKKKKSISNAQAEPEPTNGGNGFVSSLRDIFNKGWGYLHA